MFVIRAGNAYFSLKQYGKSLEDYETAITYDEDNAVYYHHQGLAFQGLHSIQQAIDAYLQVPLSNMLKLLWSFMQSGFLFFVLLGFLAVVLCDSIFAICVMICDIFVVATCVEKTARAISAIFPALVFCESEHGLSIAIEVFAFRDHLHQL